MADPKLRITWDEVQNPRIDDELRRQAAVTSATSPAQPWKNTPAVVAPSPALSSSANSSPKPVLLWVLCGVVLLVLVPVIVVAVRMAADSPHPVENLEYQSATRIESVLQQDRTVTVGTQSVAEVVRRMRAIDLNGCPNDFKSAYLAHVHAWELLADVEREVNVYLEENDTAAVIVESLIRGFLGDPLGKANEITSTENELQRSYKFASRQVLDTYHRVEEVAVAHGANLPNTKVE